jgi:hypothetical protein
VTTIALHLAVASVLTARHPGSLRPLAAAQIVSQAAGGLLLAGVVGVGILLAAVGAAARGLAAVLAQFVHLAARVTSALVITFIAMLAVVALLVHH